MAVDNNELMKMAALLQAMMGNSVGRSGGNKKKYTDPKKNSSGSEGMIELNSEMLDMSSSVQKTTNRLIYLSENLTSRGTMLTNALKHAAMGISSYRASHSRMEKTLKQDMLGATPAFKKAAHATLDLIKANKASVATIADYNKTVEVIRGAMKKYEKTVSDLDSAERRYLKFIDDKAETEKKIKEFEDEKLKALAEGKKFEASSQHQLEQLIKKQLTLKDREIRIQNELDDANLKYVNNTSDMKEAFDKLKAAGANLELYFGEMSETMRKAIESGDFMNVSAKEVAEAHKQLSSTVLGSNKTLNVFIDELGSATNRLKQSMNGFVTGLGRLALGSIMVGVPIAIKDTLSQLKNNVRESDYDGIIGTGLSMSGYADLLGQNRNEFRSAGQGDEGFLLRSGQLKELSQYAINMGVLSEDAAKMVAAQMKILRTSGTAYSKDALKYQMDSMKAIQYASGMGLEEVQNMFQVLGDSGALATLNEKYSNVPEEKRQKLVNNEILQRARMNTLLGRTNEEMLQQQQRSINSQNGPLLEKIKQQVMGEVAFSQVNAMLPKDQQVDPSRAKYFSESGLALIDLIKDPNEQNAVRSDMEKLFVQSAKFRTQGNIEAANNGNPGYLGISTSGTQFVLDELMNRAGTTEDVNGALTRNARAQADKNPVVKMMEKMFGTSFSTTTKSGNIEEIGANEKLTTTVKNVDGALEGMAQATLEATQYLTGLAKNPYTAGLAAGGLMSMLGGGVSLLGAIVQARTMGRMSRSVSVGPNGTPPVAGPQKPSFKSRVGGALKGTGKMALLTGLMLAAGGAFASDGGEAMASPLGTGDDLGKVGDLTVDTLVVKNMSGISGQNPSSIPTSTSITNQLMKNMYGIDPTAMDGLQAGNPNTDNSSSMAGIIGGGIAAWMGYDIFKSGQAGAQAASAAGSSKVLGAGRGVGTGLLTGHAFTALAGGSYEAINTMYDTDRGVDEYNKRFGLAPGLSEDIGPDENPLFNAGFWKDFGTAILGLSTDVADSATFGALGDNTWRAREQEDLMLAEMQKQTAIEENKKTEKERETQSNISNGNPAEVSPEVDLLKSLNEGLKFLVNIVSGADQRAKVMQQATTQLSSYESVKAKMMAASASKLASQS